MINFSQKKADISRSINVIIHHHLTIFVGDSLHEDIVVHGVEELRQVGINCHGKPLADIFAYFVDSAVTRTARTNPEA